MINLKSLIIPGIILAIGCLLGYFLFYKPSNKRAEAYKAREVQLNQQLQDQTKQMGVYESTIKTLGDSLKEKDFKLFKSDSVANTYKAATRAYQQKIKNLTPAQVDSFFTERYPGQTLPQMQKSIAVELVQKDELDSLNHNCERQVADLRSIKLTLEERDVQWDSLNQNLKHQIAIKDDIAKTKDDEYKLALKQVKKERFKVKVLAVVGGLLAIIAIAK